MKTHEFQKELFGVVPFAVRMKTIFSNARGSLCVVGRAQGHSPEPDDFESTKDQAPLRARTVEKYSPISEIVLQ